jgi:sugar phosphate isomerase/epimerase
MRRILDDNGIRHVELEFLNDWFLTGEPKRRSDVRKRLLFEAAAALSARAVKVGDFIRQPCPMPHLIESFATLCTEAAQYGTRIGYELMPFCIIDSLPLALELAEGAGAKNGGIFFDLWHLVKLKIPYGDIARFPQQYIIGIELNDGYIKKSLPDMALETTQHRQLCGEGEFDVRGFVEHMRGAGWSGPWGIEVLNKALRQRPIDEVTQRAFATTMAQFA